MTDLVFRLPWVNMRGGCDQAIPGFESKAIRMRCAAWASSNAALTANEVAGVGGMASRGTKEAGQNAWPPIFRECGRNMQQ